jgi:hypothetical protein
VPHQRVKRFHHFLRSRFDDGIIIIIIIVAANFFRR